MAYSVLVEGVSNGVATGVEVVVNVNIWMNVNSGGVLDGKTVKVYNKHGAFVLKVSHTANAPIRADSGVKLQNNEVEKFTIGSGEALWVLGSDRFVITEAV